MLNPAEMKNKGVVIHAINAAQTHFGETPSEISLAVNRPALEAILLAYVERYREKEATTPIEDEKLKGFDTIPCNACGETGIYAPNGGPCFRCTGKGYQLESDQKRNYGYDLHHTPAKSHDFEADAAEYAVVKYGGSDGSNVTLDEDDIPF